MKLHVKWMFAAILFVGATGAQAQVMKSADLEKYAKQKYGDKWRTCAKAIVMTHAYSNAVLDKVEEAIKNGIVGNEDEDW